jgi:16S rRNA (guanine966-N2)-methyltransferase
MTRVIAGRARGRQLTVPRGRTTRPTGDRVREAMFAAAGSVLGSFEGTRVLDLYAGSGAAGGRLVQDRVERLLARGLPAGEEPYDVLFADPPYALPGPELTGVLDVAATRGWLAPGALAIVERASRSEPLRWPSGFSPLQSRRYGEATLWYATFEDEQDEQGQRSELDEQRG